MKKDYLVRKVADGGEDVVVNAKKFDAALVALLKSKPIPQKAVAGKKRGKRS